MKIKIDSAIKPILLKDYFEKTAERIDESYYKGKAWQVILKPKEGYEYSSIPINRTLLIFSGDKDVLERIVEEYRKKFLQAGG